MVHEKLWQQKVVDLFLALLSTSSFLFLICFFCVSSRLPWHLYIDSRYAKCCNDEFLCRYNILAHSFEVQDHPKNVEVNEYEQASLMCSFKSTENIQITWEKGNDILVNNSRVKVITIPSLPVRSQPTTVSNMYLFVVFFMSQFK